MITISKEHRDSVRKELDEFIIKVNAEYEKDIIKMTEAEIIKSRRGGLGRNDSGGGGQEE